jgi:hypothetical protein
VIFGLVLLLGAFTREVNMLLIPVVFVCLFEKNRLSQEGHYAILAVIPAVVAFSLLRWFIPASGDSLIKILMTHSTKLYDVETWFRLVINPFVPLSLIPIVFYGRTAEFFSKKKYALIFAVLVFISTFFGSDNERLMAPAFVVFYWLIGTIIDSELKENKYMLILIILCAFLASLHHDISRFDFISKSLTIILTFSTLAVVTAATTFYRLKMNRQ